MEIYKNLSLDDMQGEIWKDIIGYEGYYQVSNMGRVKSLNYNHTKKPRIMKQNNSNKFGYLEIKLSKNGKDKYIKVHILVANAFIINDDPENKIQVNHKDENKLNNIVSNLEWCTRKYNINYGTRNERASNNQKGKINNGSKKQMKKVMCITTGKIFNSCAEATKYYNIKRKSSISDSINPNSRSKYAGFILDENGSEIKLEWKYVE